jgi:hypothetical protein
MGMTSRETDAPILREVKLESARLQCRIRSCRKQAIALIENSRLQKHNLANCSAKKKRSAKIRAQLHIQETQYYNSAVRFAKFSLP